VPVLARAAVATGIAGIHGNAPIREGISDGPNAGRFEKRDSATLKDIDALVKKRGFAEARCRQLAPYGVTDAPVGEVVGHRLHHDASPSATAMR
jgi:hypothetical protein